MDQLGVIKEGEDTCQPCTKQKRECIRGGNFTFKLVHSVPQRRRGSTSRVFFGYSPTQTWVPVPTVGMNYNFESGSATNQSSYHIVDFVVDPCGSEEDVESVASSPASSRSASAEPYLASGSFGDFGDPESENNFQPQSYIQDEVANSGLTSLSNTRSSASSAGVVQNERGPSGPGDAEPIPRSERDLNFAQSEISRKPQNRALHDSNVSFHSPTRQISAPSKSTPRLEGQQAILLRNYIENVAPWVCDSSSFCTTLAANSIDNKMQADAGDPLKHFATVVPQRAMQHPILLNAIFAISAQNLSLVSNYDAIQGPHYYDKCISLMIPLISPHVEEDYDENLLAATVLLRTYEEMDGNSDPRKTSFCILLTISVEDNKFHLFGSTKILNSVTKFSSSGGLGEAATWVILRQDLYISLVTKEPLFIRLENYERSHSFLKQNDYSWANIMVLLAAKVLSAAFARQTSVAREEWLRLEAAIEEWNMSKPDTFNPLGVHEAPIAKQQAFPEIWMLDDSHGKYHFPGPL